ncbi:MAG TPA: hypothetical protein IAC33_06410 [Candidatus Fimousia stercorigallinarum]|nr:hypothetical protein [Candidatus Fimousia stercorigallinarum]
MSSTQKQWMTGCTSRSLARLEEIHQKHPDMGYLRLNDKFWHDEGIGIRSGNTAPFYRVESVGFGPLYGSNWAHLDLNR